MRARSVTGSLLFGSSQRLVRSCLCSAVLSLRWIESTDVPQCRHLQTAVGRSASHEGEMHLLPPCFTRILIICCCFYRFFKEQDIASGRSPDRDQADTFYAPSRSERLYDIAPDIQDAMELRALGPNAKLVKTMSVRDSQCIRLVTPDDHVGCGFHGILLHGMGEVESPFVAKFFPAWTFTREQWADLLLPSISGVAVDTLFFSRMASPLGHRYWLFSRTGSQYDAVFLVEDFPAVFGAKDIRQVVRRRASPPGGQTIGAAQAGRQHDPPTPVVDLGTGKRTPGRVSRTVSTSPLTLDLIVMCISDRKVLPPGTSTHVRLSPASVVSTVAAVGTCTPFVASSAPVVEQPGIRAREFPTPRPLESPELLPSFGLSSSSPSPTLPWGAAEDSSPPFSPIRVQVGRSQNVPDEDSSFGVSPLSPGLIFRPPRGKTLPAARAVLLPTTLDDFDDLVLGDSITYARCERFPGSESPLSLPVCVAVGFGLSAGPSSTSDCVGSGDLRSAGGGVLDSCPSHGLGGGRVIEDRTAELSVLILGVRRTAVYRWKPGIWFTAQSSSVSGIRGNSGVGPAPVSSCRSCMNGKCCSGGPAPSGVIVPIPILLPLLFQPAGQAFVMKSNCQCRTFHTGG